MWQDLNGPVAAPPVSFSNSLTKPRNGDQVKVILIAKESEVENLGLMYLSAIARERGHDPFILFDNGQLTPTEIMDHQPQLVGFQIFTGYHKRMFSLADAIKDKVEVNIGGPHATYFQEDCRKHAHRVYKGEAITTFLTENEFDMNLLDPEKWPFPDRTQFKGSRIQNIMTSYGCVHQCTYCYNSNWQEMYQDFKVRQRSVESVCQEADMVDSELVFFQDDYFGWNLKWLREFAKVWRRPYHCQIRLDSVNEERLDLFIKSGCTGVTYAIESANEEMRAKLLHRAIPDKKLLLKAEMVGQSGLRSRTEQMLGLPGATLDDELKLVWLNCLIKPSIAWTSIFQPYRGTGLGEWCAELGWYLGMNDDIKDSFFTDTHLLWEEKGFPERPEQIRRLQRVFDVCTKLPNGWETARKFVESGEYPDLFAGARTNNYAELYGEVNQNDLKWRSAPSKLPEVEEEVEVGA